MKLRTAKTTVVMIAGLLLGGCGQGPADPDATAAEMPVLEFAAKGLRFEGPGSTRPGWQIIRLRNVSAMLHFALLQRMPEEGGLEAHQTQVAPVFQRGMDLLNAGDTDSALRVFGELPEWFGRIVFLGGPGFLSPGETAEVIVNLEPGEYLLECYVKTGGIFHSFNPSPDEFGMVHELIVAGDPMSGGPPDADLRLILSSGRGIEVQGQARSGRQIVSVYFEDQQPYEHFLGHDVHVARIEPGTELQSLGAWMDWRSADGLETPAPARFVGGLHEMPAGSTGWFRLDLAPGRYAWIAEVPDPAGRKMLKTFDVEP